MTTYYVKTDGNNALDGLSEPNAWATITHALTQMIAYDELIIAAGAYAETVAITTEHITLTGAGSGLVTVKTIQLNASYPTCSGMKATDDTCISDNPGITHISFDDIIGENMVVFTGANSATINNCDFTGLFLPVNANAAAFTNCICRPAIGGMYTIRIAGTGVINTTFENTTILGDPETFKAICILAGTNTVFTDTTFEYPEKAIEITSGATATFIQTDRKVFVGTVGINTVTPTESTLVVADGTYDYRDFIITPDASITVPETSLWETSGDQNKRWKVEATGARTIAFQLGDMLPDTEYDLLVDGAKVSSAVSDEFGVITFPAYSGTFSEKVFETEVSSGSVPKVMIF
jgi:hypothetical protein